GSDERPGRWPFGKGDLATVRVRATAREDEQIFVGIAHTTDIETYLTGVAHDQVNDVGWGRGDRDVRYTRTDGASTIAAPTAQSFWTVSASGTGEQTLTWDVEGGNWSVVMMNPDGSAGVAADVSVGIKVNAIVGLMIGLGAGSLVLLGGAAGLIVFATRRPTAAVPAPIERVPALTRSPLQLEARLDEPLSRGLWLVKWFLAIPHFIILLFLWIAFAVMTFVAGVVILFTGRYPRSIFDFNVGVLRWTWRVSYYATSGIGTDRYPPFTLAAVDYPATLDIQYPEHLSRGLVLVKWWLLAIPHYIIIGFFAGGGWFIGGDGGRAAGFGLIGWVSVFAGVALLFKNRYPRGLFDFVMGMNRWVYRVIAYAALMTDRYPPFSFDQGGTEPGPLPPPQAPVVPESADDAASDRA
ncbi:MAG TPA: DUF4389 domain-containing protein, partial [Ilumatobacteraceae bacterium]|nr:DUF4389 domain-containing protein [Ilumatobacteraceae bacterium]